MRQMTLLFVLVALIAGSAVLLRRESVTERSSMVQTKQQAVPPSAEDEHETAPVRAERSTDAYSHSVENPSTGSVSGKGVAEQSQQAAPIRLSVVEVLRNMPRMGPEDLRGAFEEEVTDPEWSDATRSEVSTQLRMKMSDRGLGVLNQDVDCRTTVCRVLLSYAVHATDSSDLRKLATPVTEITREVVGNSNVIAGGVAIHSVGLPSEPTTTEIYLSRNGSDQIMNLWHVTGVSERGGSAPFTLRSPKDK
jgi:hypothetical protein